ncbi:DUF4231 domain-containing protein [Streptomyces sp. SPB162]|uniref:DUF4231 domain-containing protein n=1 Tax=Streptomyces sp. SPB162 TaxID=2940560 RepID=UPI00240508DA|nr:DUF4231 domain-containing protein [Streptomyces sp. SPB162]
MIPSRLLRASQVRPDQEVLTKSLMANGFPYTVTMEDPGGSAPVVEAWGLQSVWSQAADQIKTSVVRARAWALVLGITAGTSGTLASEIIGSHVTAGKILAFVAAVAAAGVPLVGRCYATDRVRDWSRLRSVSETIKSELYSCLAGAAPYDQTGADAELTGRLERIRAEGRDLLHYLDGLTAVPRPLPEVTDIASYVRIRLKGQVETYYRPRFRLMARRSSSVRRAEQSLGAAGALLAALAGVTGLSWPGQWVAVSAMIALAVTAHGSAAKYDYQQMEFSRTAAELELLYRSYERSGDVSSTANSALVARCEAVISVQNDGWMVKWSTDQ